MLNKVMHKTRLTQNRKAKHTSNVKKKKNKTKKKKKRKGEREKVTESLRALFIPHIGRTFPFSKLLIR